MIIEDQTVEVKVWNHNDAVIFVYEDMYDKTDELYEGVPVMRHYQKVFTAIPVNFCCCNELEEDEKLEKVRKVASALAELYESQDGCEMSVSYYMNAHPCVNC
tara:strand:- start:883 stop:1191 length:309 start_codon:yes stop_codon:yes gene_type:complete